MVVDVEPTSVCVCDAFNSIFFRYDIVAINIESIEMREREREGNNNKKNRVFYHRNENHIR